MTTRKLFKGVKPEAIPALAQRLEELKTAHPNATILEPGLHQAIDGSEYFNDRFIIAGKLGEV